jgi:thiol-disulfide isomerase/thioredoxin
MKRIVTVLAIALFFAGGSQVVSDQCEGSDDHAKILAVKFQADYCGSCKALAPSIKELKTRRQDLF